MADATHFVQCPFVVARIHQAEISSEQVAERLERLVKHSRAKFLVLDFSEVSSITSDSLQALLTLHQSLAQQSGGIVICSPKSTLKQQLDTSEQWVVKPDVVSATSELENAGA